MIKSIDIFCTVIDNFGDIGVCWRLARQMAVEHGIKTRLYVDDKEKLKAIVPTPDMRVNILDWRIPKNYIAADLVIEAFACNLPELVILSMVKKQSVWIDLEYLTAEDWAEKCHAVPSVHPSTGLTKTLFFPGFGDKTGGLIRENDLILRRDAFLIDKNAQNLWRKAHFIPEIDDNILDISLFCYKTAPIDEFFDGLKGIRRKIRVFRPSPSLTLSRQEKECSYVEVIDIPFLSQYDYDYLLWTCDMNFVRGEDSFVRAQFARKPFVWNIYVQDKNAHFTKMDAFLHKIKPFYEDSSFESLAILYDLWNEGGRNTDKNAKEIWTNCLRSFAGFQSGAQNWSDYLMNQTDLSTRLLAFAETQMIKDKDKLL